MKLKFFRFLALCLLMIIFTSCSTQKFSINHLEKISWIEGNWTSFNSDYQIVEKWNFSRETSCYYGNSKLYIEHNLIYDETNRICFENKKILLHRNNNTSNENKDNILWAKKLTKKCAFFENKSTRQNLKYRKKKNYLLVELVENNDINKYYLKKTQE